MILFYVFRNFILQFNLVFKTRCVEYGYLFLRKVLEAGNKIIIKNIIMKLLPNLIIACVVKFFYYNGSPTGLQAEC